MSVLKENNGVVLRNFIYYIFEELFSYFCSTKRISFKIKIISFLAISVFSVDKTISQRFLATLGLG